MIVTWTALRCRTASRDSPWLPEGALFAQAGHAGPGRVQIPTFDGSWWAVLATWPDARSARAAAPSAGAGLDAWHVVLDAASFRGDAVLSGGARPFDSLPGTGKTAGASAVVTLAGLGDDAARTEEFFRHVVRRGEDVERAPGHRAALVQAPPDGALLTFSAWDSLRSAVTWAYHRPEHAGTVARQEEHGLVATSGFLRCAVLSSSGRLGDRPDPLAGLTGTVTRGGSTAVAAHPLEEHA